jgi:NAD(P)-dependent dehydrogenase (short-subunit alcohol dehydrogenase family)
MNLDRKVCLVTGGTSGIGAAVAVKFARLGADLAICGRTIQDPACGVVKEIEAFGVRCLATPVDVSQPAQATAWVGRTIADLGGVDVLVHCAGGPAPGSLMEVPEQAWYAAFDLHVHAIFHLSRAVVPSMRARGGGAMVLISSAAGRRGCAGAIAYGVVKGAIPQFTRALARELAADNIRVNCVSPGIIRTPFQNHLTPEQVRNNIDNRIPLHREGAPQDVAAAIVALVTNDFITGEDLAVDGGMTMRIA